MVAILSGEAHRSLADAEVQNIGSQLYDALRSRAPLTPLTERFSQMTIEDAYAASLEFLALREADGERVVGKKIGVTSQAVQEMLGVFQPDFGFLTDAMDRSADGVVPIEGQLIAPRIEAEIGFRLKSVLTGPGITENDVLKATDYVFPCFEVVDSRIMDWRISIQDTIADNASCGVFVMGKATCNPRALNLPGIRIRVWKNGDLECEGFGSAVQGNPLTAVAWLANTLGSRGVTLNAGDLILSGSVTPLLPAVAGDSFEMELEGVGRANATFV